MSQRANPRSLSVPGFQPHQYQSEAIGSNFAPILFPWPGPDRPQGPRISSRWFGVRICSDTKNPDSPIMGDRD